MGGVPFDPEELAWRWEMNWFYDELDENVEWIGQLVDLLAWLLRQMKDPRPIADRNNWPDVWLMDRPETQQGALADPLLFDLARHQAAEDLIEDEELKVFDMTGWLVVLLRAERPASGQGVRPGAAGVRLIVNTLYAELREMNIWSLRERRTNPVDAFSAEPTRYAFAHALSARLNENPFLHETPNAVLSPEAIRRLL